MDKNKLSSYIKKALIKTKTYQARWNRYWIDHRDQMYGRERVGVDKFGNQYYQYYSYHGLPTKRVVIYKFFDTNNFHNDPHFIGWLRRNELLPPTPEQLEKLYLEHDAFVQRGIEWDEQQKLMIEQFKDKKKELDEIYEREQLNSIAKEWDRGLQAIDTTEIAVFTELDQIQKDFLDELNYILAKDK